MSNDNKFSRLRISMEFAGMLLPTLPGPSGREVVPLKPISDIIRLQWEQQREQLNEARLKSRLGICDPIVEWAGQSRRMTCIRVDRIVAWMNTINPADVRAQGHAAAADFLLKRQDEWDDLVHEHDTVHGIFAHSRMPPLERDPEIAGIFWRSIGRFLKRRTRRNGELWESR